MSGVILTSCLDFYEKDENGNKIVHHFGNVNRILDCLKSHIKNYDNFLFVARGNDDESTEQYFNNACKSFELTLPFKNYNILFFMFFEKLINYGQVFISEFLYFFFEIRVKLRIDPRHIIPTFSKTAYRTLKAHICRKVK